MLIRNHVLNIFLKKHKFHIFDFSGHKYVQITITIPNDLENTFFNFNR